MYDPSDDTFLLVDAVERLEPGLLLEVGTGTGLVAIVAARAGHRVAATDLSPLALRLAARNARRNGAAVDFVRADLLSGLRGARFDTIALNPPYLPTVAKDHVPGPLNLAFDGGPQGRRVVEKFLAQASPARRLLLVASSLQGPDALDRLLRRFGLDVAVQAERAFSHERLRVLELRGVSRKT